LIRARRPKRCTTIDGATQQPLQGEDLLPIRITQAFVEFQHLRLCNLTYIARRLNIIAQLLDVDLGRGRGKPPFFKEMILIYT